MWINIKKINLSRGNSPSSALSRFFLTVVEAAATQKVHEEVDDGVSFALPIVVAVGFDGGPFTVKACFFDAGVVLGLIFPGEPGILDPTPFDHVFKQFLVRYLN